MNSSILAALRRLQKADQQCQTAKERLLAVWEQVAQQDEATAATIWDSVEEAYLVGEMGAIMALTYRLEAMLRVPPPV
jgi:hypothetical protein